ncbi:hypothetical protein [Aeromicrobium sp. HA]|uniref:hypothetical protein n=1 Tax=Aeromicrobium sp. HA TaxID=3009077 RepID=UPI0022AF26F9|nr:hypothetical protein [Aeromicrobium sp. HA]
MRRDVPALPHWLRDPVIADWLDPEEHGLSERARRSIATRRWVGAVTDWYADWLDARAAMSSPLDFGDDVTRRREELDATESGDGNGEDRRTTDWARSVAVGNERPFYGRST